jgi:hypothetical protein
VPARLVCREGGQVCCGEQHGPRHCPTVAALLVEVPVDEAGRVRSPGVQRCRGAFFVADLQQGYGVLASLPVTL